MTEIVVADGSELFREGIAALLETVSGYRIIDKCSDGRQLLAAAESLRPDVAVVDSSLAGLNGLDCSRNLSKSGSRTRVVLMANYIDEILVAEMIEAGVSGCVLKCGRADELVNAIESRSRSKVYLSNEIRESIQLSMGGHRPNELLRPNGLTLREREILQLIGEGNSSKAIASKLSISQTTVKTHRDHLMDKLNVREIAGLTRESIRMRLVNVD